MNITLSPKEAKLVSEKVQRGEYRNVNAVISQALYALTEREQSLKDIREKIERGFQQSERGELVCGKEVLAELRQMSEERRRGSDREV